MTDQPDRERRRGRSRVNAVTSAVGVSGIAGAVALAAVLPGSHASTSSSTTTSSTSTSTDPTSNSDNSSSSNSTTDDSTTDNSNSTTTNQAPAPDTTTSPAHATSGGS